jgi:Phage Mu protein F like protein
MPTEIRADVGLKPLETVEFFRAKGTYPISRRWWEVWQEEHARAFTVAGITKRSVLETVRLSMEKVLSEGGTFEMWKSGILSDLRTAVENGTAPPNILTDARLRTIYSTNLRMARAAGQWKRIQGLKDAAPFLMYWAVKDDHTRPLHRVWGGLDTGTKPIVLPVDHPAWSLFYPPNGWGCRCNVIQLSQLDLDRMGLSVTNDVTLVALGWPTNHDFSGIDQRDWLRGDGIVEQVPNGIDPGFAYNVGAAHFRGLGEALATSLEILAKRDVATARAALQDELEQTVFTPFLETPNASFPVMILDGDQQALVASQTSIVRLSSETYAKQLHEHPEIGIDQYRQLVALGTKPEIILKQGELRIILIKDSGSKWLKATIKVTRDGHDLFLVSYQFADAREVSRLRRNNEVIANAG